MTTQQETTSEKLVQTCMAILQDLLEDYWPRNFAVRLWDGTKWEADRGMPTRFTLVINNPSVVRAMVREPRELALAEAYIRKDLDVEGDITAVFPVADYLIDRKWTLRQRLNMGRQFYRIPSVNNGNNGSSNGGNHSREQDRQAIAFHYDISNDFYALWLDRRMIYSCAYFDHPGQSLDRAQDQKLEYICRKLRLRPGERLLDIGCGWGGLIMYAARRHRVHARGITLSPAQYDLARDRVRSQGLDAMCEVALGDYRDLSEETGYDKIVSVGMFEHVGQALLPAYFRKVWSLLKPGGVFVNQGIASNPLVPNRPGPTFTERCVFPNGDLVPLSTTVRVAEMSGFEVRDVESLREHYALTLRRWVNRLEDKFDDACRMTSERTCRIWRLYMAASAHNFRTGRLNVYQALMVKPDHGSSRLPLTRKDWYA